jgi:hypothetical protein
MLYTCTTLIYTVMRKHNQPQSKLNPKNTDKVITLLSNFFSGFSTKEVENSLFQATQAFIEYDHAHNSDKASTVLVAHEIVQLLTALEKINNKVNKEAVSC